MKDWKERFDEMFDWKDCGDFNSSFDNQTIRPCIKCGEDTMWCKSCSNDHHIGNRDTAIKNFIEQLISERDKEIIKMLENTDVQMSVNGDVSQDEIAVAKFIYKAHIRHIIKKIGSAIIPPNPINGTLPSETDSATK